MKRFNLVEAAASIVIGLGLIATIAYAGTTVRNVSQDGNTVVIKGVSATTTTVLSGTRSYGHFEFVDTSSSPVMFELCETSGLTGCTVYYTIPAAGQQAIDAASSTTYSSGRTVVEIPNSVFTNLGIRAKNFSNTIVDTTTLSVTIKPWY
jgi:hypothetical protein